MENDRCMDSKVLQMSIVFFDLKREPKVPCPSDHLPRRPYRTMNLDTSDQPCDLNFEERPLDLSRVARRIHRLHLIVGGTLQMNCSVLRKIGSWACCPHWKVWNALWQRVFAQTVGLDHTVLMDHTCQRVSFLPHLQVTYMTYRITLGARLPSTLEK